MPVIVSPLTLSCCFRKSQYSQSSVLDCTPPPRPPFASHYRFLNSSHLLWEQRGTGGCNKSLSSWRWEEILSKVKGSFTRRRVCLKTQKIFSWFLPRVCTKPAFSLKRHIFENAPRGAEVWKRHLALQPVQSRGADNTHSHNEVDQQTCYCYWWSACSLPIKPPLQWIWKQL